MDDLNWMTVAQTIAAGATNRLFGQHKRAPGETKIVVSEFVIRMNVCVGRAVAPFTATGAEESAALQYAFLTSCPIDCQLSDGNLTFEYANEEFDTTSLSTDFYDHYTAS